MPPGIPMLRRVALLVTCASLGGLGRPAAAAPDAPPPVRVAVIAPLSGPLAGLGADTLVGARAAAAFFGGKTVPRAVEILPFDDRDDPAAAEKAHVAAFQAKADAVVVGSSGRVVDAVVARARKAKWAPPTFVVGGHLPSRLSLDAADPVLALGAGPVDEAVHLANLLVLPARAKAPALVAEDSPRGREREEALVRNLGRDRRLVATVRVAPGARLADADVAALRDAKPDRLVVLGEADLVDAVVGAGLDVPLLGGAGTLSSASTAAAEGRAAGALFAVGTPQRTLDGAPRPLYDAVEATTPPGRPVTVWPRSVGAYTAVDLLLEALAALPAPAKGRKAPADAALLAAVRDRRYGPDESRTPVFDVAGRAALWRWGAATGADGGVKPVDPGFLGNDAFGPFLGLRSPSLYRAEPGTKVVWVTFGDAASKPPRTIEKDLGELGLGTRGYEGSLDGMVLDELLARALGKLNRLFLRNEDGTPIPGVSFQVSFTTTFPADRKPSEVWTMVVAGDDAEAGGRAFPGEGRCEVYATFLRRTIFQAGALTPRLDHDDLAWVNGTHLWKGVKLEHLRADQVRALVDGYAGAFALTGAHEVGHLAGLGHDTTDERSIMNVTEGAGLRETAAFFIPGHAAVIERLVGRTPVPKEPKR